MKSTALQQQLYQYRDSKLSELKEEYERDIEAFKKECDEYILKRKKELEENLTYNLEEYNNKELSQAYKQAKDIIQTARLNEKMRIIDEVCSSFENVFVEMTQIFVSRASEILDVDTKEIRISVSSALSKSIISKLRSIFSNNTIVTQRSIQKYEVVCQKAHLIVRCNFRDEINALLFKEIDNQAVVDVN